MRAAARALFIVTVALGVDGCSSDGAASLALSWQFVDGRRCADSGAAFISVQVGSAMATDFNCDDGFLPAAATIVNVPRDGTTLKVQALSTESAPLYAGTLTLDALPSAATITLYADEMR